MLEINNNEISIDKINSSVQVYLRDAANQSGLSDLEISKKANLPQSTTYRILNAKTLNPSYALVLKICETLNVPLPDKIDIVSKDERLLISGAGEHSNLSPSKINTHPHCLIKEGHKQLEAVIVNNTYNRDFPIGTVLHYVRTLDALILKEGNRVIVCNEINSEAYYSLAVIISAPFDEHWIIYDLGEPLQDDRICLMPKDSISIVHNDRVVSIVGCVVSAKIYEKSLISNT